MPLEILDSSTLAANDTVYTLWKKLGGEESKSVYDNGVVDYSNMS